jgi:hypothetical protein
MRRAPTLGLAIVLTLGLAVSASQAAKPKKVATEAEIEFVDAEPSGTTFKGDISSRKPKCEKGRDVTVIYTGSFPGVDDPVGTATTDRTGDWILSRPNTGLAVGTYVIDVDRRKIKMGDKQIICKATTSPPFEHEL